ncbi:MAG: hypothetical protein U0X71_07005 [Sphingobacteriaceae bacterium]
MSQGSDANYNNSPVPISTTITINKGTPTLSITGTTLSMVVGSTATVSALSVPPLVGGVSTWAVLHIVSYQEVVVQRSTAVQG